MSEDEELIREAIRLDYSQLVMNNVYLHKENERLNNIINELEKDLEDMYYGRGKYHMDSDVIGIKDVLDKLQELKGSDKE